MIFNTSLPDIFACPVRYDLEAYDLRLIFVIVICSYVNVELLLLERDLDYLRPGIQLISHLYYAEISTVCQPRES